MRDSEATILSHLTETDSLDVLAREGFSGEAAVVLTKEETRKIVQWGLEKYFETGRLRPVSKTMIVETWGDALEALGVEINDETELDSIEWVIEDLRSAYVQRVSNDFATDLVTAISYADGPDRAKVLTEHTHRLFVEARKVQSRRQEATAGEGLDMALQRYYARTKVDEEIDGLAFGMPSIDSYTMGIHDGELALFAAASGDGKSWLGTKAAFAEWQRKRRAILFTLENSLDMTFDRLACLGAGANYELWQRGRLPDVVVSRVEAVRDAILASEHQPLVVMPPTGERTMEMMIRRAFSEGADSLIIDQLTFVELVKSSSRDPRWAQFGETIHQCKELISSGREKLPCLLLHQIKGEGVARARKTGHYVMDDLAEAREIDRTADFVFAVYRDEMARRDDEAEWQTLKARRVPGMRDWPMIWHLGLGDIAVMGDDRPEQIGAPE